MKEMRDEWEEILWERSMRSINKMRNRRKER
jgi:hypothetical protein